MANTEHLNKLREGAEAWNAWRLADTSVFIDLEFADLRDFNLSKCVLHAVKLNRAILSGADLNHAEMANAEIRQADLTAANFSDAYLFGSDFTGTKLNNAALERANLSEAKLYYAKLNGAKLTGATMIKTNLTYADLSDANLSGANLEGADLRNAILVNANLTDANLSNAMLDNANLTGANLSNANLTRANLVETDFTGAILTGCKVYGISAWNLKLENTQQNNLIISRENEHVMSVDNLSVAQFIYLMINNKNIRDVLNTVTSKGVLILGRFSDPRRKAVLDGLRDKLRQFDLLPMMFDFDHPTDKDFTETVQTLAGMSMFVIADITNPRSAPMELEATAKQFKIPFIPILEVTVEKSGFAMLADLQKSFHWVLPTRAFNSIEELLDDEYLKQCILEPAYQKREELRKAKEDRPEMVFFKKKTENTPPA